MINIVFSDSSGGVRSVSQTLSEAFDGKKIPNRLFNMRNFRGGLLLRMLFSIRALRERKDEIFILQHFDAIALGLFLRVFGFKKCIFVVHTDLVSYVENAGFVKGAVVKFLFMLIKNESIVFVSRESKIRASSQFSLPNACCIYNVFYFDVVLDKNRVADEINLISVARLEISKNIDLCIRVVAEVRRLGYPVKLSIYGKGSEYSRLNHYIDVIGCNDFVTLMGGDASKDAIYSGADALLSFSSIEGFGLTILEGINYKVPIFFTDCSSGPRELMSPESNPLIKTSGYEITNVGYLVKPVIDVASYSATLTAYEEEYVGILENFISDVRAGKFSMEYDDSAFSEAVVVDQWLKIIDEL